MCKHILNAQVQIHPPCCEDGKWFDCPQCHESEDHKIKKRAEMEFLCKKCEKQFTKDSTDFEESDEYCPHCDNHYILVAKEPQAVLKVESEDTRVDSRFLKDDRIGAEPLRTIFNVKDAPDRLG